MSSCKDQISKHISYTEATKSPTALKLGIDNTPTLDALDNMKNVAEKVFQPLREHFCVPIAVTSFYRSPKLNSKIGGVTSSQHTTGEAIDLDADVLGIITNKRIFDYIYNKLEYDQLIWEFGNDDNPAWVHVSLKKDGQNRNQALQGYKEKNVFGKEVTKYKVYVKR